MFFVLDFLGYNLFMRRVRLDVPFLLSVLILVIGGFLIFSSASLGLLSKQAIKYSGVTFNQTFFGLFLGLLAFYITSQINFKLYHKYAPHLFLFSVVFTLLVFVPHIGVSAGGAARWIYIGPLSVQPSELLKLFYIMFLAAWFSNPKNKADSFKKGLLPFLVLTSIIGLILLKQPDTDTFLICVFSGLSIYLISGGRWFYIFLLSLVGFLAIGFLAYERPYVMSRINTFIHPENNSLGSGYQIQQSLIAIGSGGILGRGFGQSVQKFNYLPEPIGDSIFAVAGEEFGFIGTVALIFLFLFFTFRGLKIANKVPDNFGRLLIVGIVIMIVSQAFVNIGAMVGILPLSGITLPFVSHGGTALFITLAESGIILNISKSIKKIKK